MGEILKNLRKAKKVTQLELATYLGIKQNSYQSYEANKANPPIDMLIKLADFYDVTLDYLVGRPYSNEFGYLDDQEKAMLKTFRALSDTGKTKVASYSLGILAMEN